jgi:phospholipase C
LAQKSFAACREWRRVMIVGVLAGAGLVMVTATIFMTARSYGKLPQRVPLHFGLDGSVNTWGPRPAVWLVPAIQLAIATMDALVFSSGAEPVRGLLLADFILALMWRAQLLIITTATSGKTKADLSGFWLTLLVTLGAAGLLLAACSSRTSVVPNPTAGALNVRPLATHKIAHVVVVIQENRSFNDLFATFPGAKGTTEGKMSDGRTVELSKSDLNVHYDLGHSWNEFLGDYAGGKMDGFDLEAGGGSGGRAGTRPYQYVDPKQVASYWDIAKSYVLADEMFATQGSGSYTAHQDLIRGGTQINDKESLIDYPSHTPWGCDAPKNTTTSVLLVQTQKYLPYGGPFPCLKYATLRDLLDEKGAGWKYYSPPVAIGKSGATWNAFDSIRAVRYGREWNLNVTSSANRFFRDVKEGELPAVSWVIPDLANSDHPRSGSDTGPSWVAGIVNAVGESKYWSSSAVIIVWDDWGGFYDPVPPPFRDHSGGLGFRVAMLVVSPYARKGRVSHTQYEFGSILRFIEDTWDLGRLGTSDVRATSIGDCFDFTQQPRAFVPIPAKYSRAFFENQPPSYQPVDTQ